MLGRIKELRAAGTAYSLAAILIVTASFVAADIPIWGDLGTFVWPQVGIALATLVGVALAGKGARHTLQLRLPRISDMLLCALMAILILPASLYLASLVMLVVELIFGSTMIDAALSGNVKAPWLTILTMCVCPAIFEELLFRGVVFKGMSQNLSIRKAILISALCFGLFHMDFQRLISQTLLGALCAFAVYRTKSIVAGMTIHFVNNGVAVGISLVAQMFEPMAEHEMVSTNLLSTFEVTAAELGVSTTMAIAVYVAVSLVMAAVSLAVTYAVLRAFINWTEPFHEQGDDVGPPLLATSELQPRDADAVYLRSKRTIAKACFIPGFIVIALTNLMVALMLTNVI